MQQANLQQEERYDDGPGEYTRFYEGPSYSYLTTSKTSSPRTAYTSQPSVTHHRRRSAAAKLQHAISYDLAANVPGLRRYAEGPPLGYRDGGSSAPAPYHFTTQGYTREAEGNHIIHQHPNYGSSSPRQISNPRHRVPHMPDPMQAAPPVPLRFRRRSSVIDRELVQFPQPPTSPTSTISPTNQRFVHHLAQKPVPQQPLPELPEGPQPLILQRPVPLPPTPPRSYEARSTEDVLRDQIKALNMGEPSPVLGKHAAGLPRFHSGTFYRMNTVSSVSDGLSSSVPGSPFDQQHRISVALSNTTIHGVIAQGPTWTSRVDAHAEVMRLLDKIDDASTRKLAPAAKTRFLMRRHNTSKPASGAKHSQDALTDVLENVAEKGSLPMVKAVIALGADPVYRSTSKLKKIKHEALAKATAAGRANVVDFLLCKGATYGESQKKSTFTPLDRALLTAVYKGYADLARVLISSHGGNPMIEQWPREMDDAKHYWAQNQVRLSRSSVLDGISHWKSEQQGMSVLRVVMSNPKFDPTASVSGVFDNKSELQSAKFAYRPWNTTYEYSALSCFVRVGWAEAVEEMLGKKGLPEYYEKEDEVLQYQNKVDRYISPMNALTKDTWEQRPQDALHILRVLIDRGFNVNLPQRTANDLGQRTTLARALSANASQAVELIVQARPKLVREVISFRHNKQETQAQPLAAAIALEKLDTAHVLLRMGAHPRDPAFDTNVLHFCAHQGGETGTLMLAEMIGLAPELTYGALDIAMRRLNTDCVRVLLDSISAAAARNEIAALPAIWDMLLPLPAVVVEKSLATISSYLSIIDMVDAWDAGHVLPAPQLPAILAAIRRDNYVGMERLLKLGVIDGKWLVLNRQAQPMGEQRTWTVLECAEGTQRSSDWLDLLRRWGAPLYS